jgi:integrase
MTKRRFGRVRRLPSGRYQARYPGPDGIDRAAPQTFASKTEADVWLTMKEAEIRRGDWIDPDASAVLLADFGATWIEERPGLRPETITLYRYQLRAHIAPHFAGVTVAGVTLAWVRSWRKALLDSGVSAVTAAKAYRLLRAILNTAVDDGLIRSNPCRVKGADKETSPERPVLTVAQVFDLADNIGPRYGSLVLLATFASLRWAELAALSPADIDTDACTVRVVRQIEYLPGGPLVRAAQVPRRPSCRLVPRPHRAAAAQASRRPRPNDGTRLHQPRGRAAAAQQLLPPRLDARTQVGRSGRRPPARPAAHRQPVLGRRGRQHP